MVVKALVFDVDGVLKRGSEPIPSAVDVVNKLAGDYEIFVLSNNSELSREEYASHLRAMGYPISASHVYNGSYAISKFISEHFSSTTVYAIGEGIKKDLAFFGFKIGEEARVVAVGFDRHLTYPQLAIAFRLIKDGAFFVATDRDRYFPSEEGLLPGAGMYVEGLEYATSIKAYIVGKPETYMAELLLAENNLSPDEIVIIGDNVESDIALAKKIKAKSVWIDKEEKISLLPSLLEEIV